MDYPLPMVGPEEAVEWVQQNIVPKNQEEMKQRVLKRIIYECAKGIPVKPKFIKGMYERKHDSYSCGNCGFGFQKSLLSMYKYCPNCGYAVAEVKRDERNL